MPAGTDRKPTDIIVFLRRHYPYQVQGSSGSITFISAGKIQLPVYQVVPLYYASLYVLSTAFSSNRKISPVQLS